MQPLGVAAVHILDHLGGVVICCCYLHEACARCRIPACFFGAEEAANSSVDSSVLSRRSEEHQKFVAEVRLNWNPTEQSPDQLHSEALILI